MFHYWSDFIALFCNMKRVEVRYESVPVSMLLDVIMCWAVFISCNSSSVVSIEIRLVYVDVIVSHAATDLHTDCLVCCVTTEWWGSQCSLDSPGLWLTVLWGSQCSLDSPGLWLTVLRGSQCSRDSPALWLTVLWGSQCSLDSPGLWLTVAVLHLCLLRTCKLHAD